MGPPDPILGLTAAFNEDKNPKKQLFGVGAYRDAQNKPFVLECVRTAEAAIVAAKMNKEYLGIVGLPDFVTLAVKLMLGPDAYKDGNIAAVQTLSGTGGCRLAGDFFARFLGKETPFYLPNPSWANHKNIFTDAGLAVKTYRYWDKATLGLDLGGMLADIAAMPAGSALLLHACAHNPTGVDPTEAQWAQIADALAKKPDVRILFDAAYQGFASGDPERDAAAVRMFKARGLPFILVQSFAKNFGLYGERVGALSVVCADADEAKRVESQLKILIRPFYSNPPAHGARIVAKILGDPVRAQGGGKAARSGSECDGATPLPRRRTARARPPASRWRAADRPLRARTPFRPAVRQAMTAQWRTECRGMADRIIEMRAKLRALLEASGSAKPWAHVTDQIGMFCYSGLSEAQVDRLRADYSIYFTKDGRISMAGVTNDNVEYLAAGIHAVTR
jgi:aspartate aminotransferase